MLPSSTVENYLKAIVVQQHAAGDGLVPMGHVAAALGVTPGTATTMVKTLADSGLVQYEPYSGVRLTTAGEKLAGLVLRRHRLVELFLVQVMDMRWDEVHEEAEKLEHVVSERLIERMDEMLGRPQVDPHGDPIPDADGAIRHRDLHTLLDCPLNTPVTITRVTDQDAEFLRFIEESHLKPGQSIEVEARDQRADSVRVRGHEERRLTIGARAASKLLVELVPLVLVWVLALGANAAAQTPRPASSPAAGQDRNRPFEIVDNSFLVEEAFNQEAGIFQNIAGFVRTETGEWAGGFTQEWPVRGVRHQLSYTFTFADDVGGSRFSDVGLTYRYQWLTGEQGRLAVSPRLTMLVHTEARDGDDHGKVGWQVNLPASRQFGDVFLHGNAGLTWYPRVEGPGDGAAANTVPRAARDLTLVSPFASGSAILRLAPMFNLMLETVVQYEDRVIAPGRTARSRVVTVSPGTRFGWNLGNQQLILGVAMPIATEAGSTTTGVFTYASWELPFVW